MTWHRTETKVQQMPRDEPNAPIPVRHACLFRNGRNQAVRIPREFELAADEVMIYREDDRLIVEPIKRSSTLAEVLARLTRLDENFPDIADPPARPEELL